MLTVTKAFYYFPLEIGNIFIGWMGTIAYLTLSIMSIIYAKQFSPFTFVVEVIAIICIVHVIGCVLLIIGIMKKSHLLILPWLFGQFLLKIVSLLIAIGALIYLPILVALCFAFVITVWIVVHLYLWICVYSIFEKIQFNRNRKYATLQEDLSVCGGV